MISTDKRDAPELKTDWGKACKDVYHPNVDHEFEDFGTYIKPGNSKDQGVDLCSCVLCGYVQPKNRLKPIPPPSRRLKEGQQPLKTLPDVDPDRVKWIEPH